MRHLGIPRSSRSTRASGSRSSRPPLGRNGDARRHPRRGARPAGRGRVRPRLVPRRLADRRGGPARLAVEPRVARRVPPRPPRLPRGGRLRLLLRDPGLPGPRGLRRGRGARAAPPRLKRRGLRLILDFVPNHMAPDHPWVSRAPGLLRVGDGGAARRAAPELLPRRRRAGPAHPGVRARPVLRRLAGHAPAELRQPGPPGGDARRAAPHRRQCDGVRCDMAMLVLPEVFERTWGITAARRSGPGRRRPSAAEASRASSSWPRSTGTSSGPLQQQGFDYTYDKRLYDRLAEGHARPVREHLFAGLDFQDHLARFLENHDEPRAAATFAPEVHRAAAILTFLTPGLRFFHQGQREGKRVRIPVHLGRGPDEATDAGDRRVLRPAPGVPEGPGLPRRRLAAPRVPSGLGRKRHVGRLRGLLLDRPGREAPPRRRQLRRSPEPVLRRDALARPRRADVAPPGSRRALRLRPRGRRPDGAGALPRRARRGATTCSPSRPRSDGEPGASRTRLKGRRRC